LSPEISTCEIYIISLKTSPRFTSASSLREALSISAQPPALRGAAPSPSLAFFSFFLPSDHP
jgi:hypothetical protein